MAKLYRALVWSVLGITVAVQILAAVGIMNNQATTFFNPIYLLIAAATLLLSTIAFFVVPRGKWIPFTIAVLAGIAHIVLAVVMMSAFPIVVHPLGNSTGISVWNAVWRHMSPILVPLLLTPLWWQHHQENVAEKQAEQAEQAENTPSYFDMLDESYRMRSLDDDDARKPKPKRSMRGKENDR